MRKHQFEVLLRSEIKVIRHVSAYLNGVVMIVDNTNYATRGGLSTPGWRRFFGDGGLPAETRHC